MTREEQMKAAAKCECSDELQRIIFCIGALWADRNPRKYTWVSVKDSLPKDGQLILYSKKGGETGRRFYETIYYPEPRITDDMDYWMPIEEIKEDTK